LLGVARVLIAEGHNIVCLSGSALRDRIESAGAEFRALPPAADFDLNDPFATAPELKLIPPDLEWPRVALERRFIETHRPAARKHAIELVREGRSGLAEIAACTGFADQSHLSRWVRRVYGVPLSGLTA
jgi:AraC-like DNA-binding protein